MVGWELVASVYWKVRCLWRQVSGRWGRVDLFVTRLLWTLGREGVEKDASVDWSVVRFGFDTQCGVVCVSTCAVLIEVGEEVGECGGPPTVVWLAAKV